MIEFLGWCVFAVGLVCITAGIAVGIHIVFFAKSNAQSQCPYCETVWRDETMFLEWWHDHVSFPWHIRQTPYHAERHRWFKQDYNAFGLQIALDMQRERIKNGLERPLAQTVPAYWQDDYEDEEY